MSSILIGLVVMVVLRLILGGYHFTGLLAAGNLILVIMHGITIGTRQPEWKASIGFIILHSILLIAAYNKLTLLSKMRGLDG